MTWHLRNEGHLVNEKRIRRLMRLMGPLSADCYAIACRATDADLPEAQYQQGGEGSQDLPLSVARAAGGRPNQVWCADITYLPMRRGFLYLVAIMDWHTRQVLAWRISNTLEADFCVEALNEAIHRFGPPEIMNTDQGSQFTSFAWTNCVKQAGVRISMDGKGRFLDNIFIERLWRSMKYECVYLHAWESGSEAKNGIKKWMEFYNPKRPHSALGRKPPAVVYWQTIETNKPDRQMQRVA